MDFVIFVLQEVFHHPFDRAERIMLSVHKEGMGVAGIFRLEIAEQKALLDDLRPELEELKIQEEILQYRNRLDQITSDRSMLELEIKSQMNLLEEEHQKDGCRSSINDVPKTGFGRILFT